MTAAPAPEIAPAVATEHQPPARRAAPALRAARVHLGYALRNDGIRRLGLAWMLGIAADGALVVVTLVTVYNRGGVIAAGLLGAFRMVPAGGSGGVPRPPPGPVPGGWALRAPRALPAGAAAP